MSRSIDSAYVLKRTALGVFAMLGVGLVLGELPNPFAANLPHEGFSYFSPAFNAWVALETAVAAGVGACVARTRFAIVAVLVAAASGLASFRFLQWIAEPVHYVPYTEILARNCIGLSCTIVAAAIGAELGMRAAQRRTPTIADD